jgi:UPF0755 protein
MKKLVVTLFMLLVVIACVAAWLFLGPATGFDGPKRALYIRTAAATKEAVLDSIAKNRIITNTASFNWLAARMDLWKNIRPGKYEIKKGTSVLSLIRMLRNGRQTPVNLVITKLRTKEDLARLTGNKFECDSLQMIRFLSNNDSVSKFDADTNTVMSMVLPDTYTYFWNSTAETILKKIAEASKNYWSEERKKKAEAHGLTPTQAYILASIVEEETTNNAEKGNIASVYLNRLNKGMPLGADPTIKFALKDFGLKRIYEKYLTVASPYNTYRNKGLPPGPICTPSKKTIEAILDAPRTDYLYFVASPGVRETHDFSSTYQEHLQKARAYHQELNRRDSLNKSKTEIK